MGAPSDNRRLSIVVNGKVIFRLFDGFARLFITDILILERVGVVFGMTCDKYLLTLFGHNGVDARFLAFGEDFELLVRLYIRL